MATEKQYEKEGNSLKVITPKEPEVQRISLDYINERKIELNSIIDKANAELVQLQAYEDKYNEIVKDK